MGGGGVQEARTTQGEGIVLVPLGGRVGGVREEPTLDVRDGYHWFGAIRTSGGDEYTIDAASEGQSGDAARDEAMLFIQDRTMTT